MQQEDAPRIGLEQEAKRILTRFGIVHVEDRQAKRKSIEIDKRLLHTQPPPEVGLGKALELQELLPNVDRWIWWPAPKLAEDFSEGIATGDRKDAVHDIDSLHLLKFSHVMDCVQTSHDTGFLG